MATSKEVAHTYPADYESVFSAACTALQSLGMGIQLADQATGAIRVSSSVSMASWGENVNIQVGVDPAGQTQVAVRSALKFGLVDWGKNQKNIDTIFLRITDVLQNPAGYAAGAAGGAAAAGAWHPDPTGRHEFRWWDGTAWSDQVSDGGTVASDPI